MDTGSIASCYKILAFALTFTFVFSLTSCLICKSSLPVCRCRSQSFETGLQDTSVELNREVAAVANNQERLQDPGLTVRSITVTSITNKPSKWDSGDSGDPSLKAGSSLFIKPSPSDKVPKSPPYI